MNRKTRIVSDGHYFTYQAILQYESSTGNVNTHGALHFEFDIYNTTDSSRTHVSKDIDLAYTARP
ncbi:hypothetical protein FACS18949_15050 [Clostridia bacterium]|nr:hypothetical protein FACS189425_01080 [Clostridia bacterium]GHV36066.1 hypothetical protein FACS18949_15050 [Clostridia bacterium]